MTDSPRIHLCRSNAGCTLAAQLGAVAIVVDALRASTTIPALFQQGVARVRVVAGVEEARMLAAAMPGSLLVGERGGERLPGFDFGNSPLEILAAPRLDDRTVVFTSSNGAQRIGASKDADRIVMGSVANAGAVTKWAREYAITHGRPVVLIAAGKYPDEAFISPEDEASCVYLAERIGLPVAEDSADHFAYWRGEIDTRGLAEVFRASAHAQHLVAIGYGEDVEFCSRPDTLTAVPVFTEALLRDGLVLGGEMRLLTGSGDLIGLDS